jgi:sugar phosphate permease
MRAGTVALIVGLFLFPLPTHAWMLAAIMPCVPVGTALLFPATTSLLSRHVSRAEYGTVMGVAQTFAGVSRVIAPVLATNAFQRLGHAAPFYMAGAIVALVGLLAFQVRVAPHTVQAAPASAPESPS